ncbi:hypothetical protein [Brevibacillus laterosporus]|uniref:hypothetical protein n=1 Tax=Brevibacillus laterosporus TaxID=1465 RepID=UPI000CE4F57A|nr:hypothetical protein [Brevibacillus laterosporus]AYB39082.1 hypothetical protein D5F52_12845 [Brevibacillus laterosporus]MBG9773747.1 hypothetical protein [Brevibacillus laterosporus]MBM7110912.1 Chromosome partition protein Smc [Brevibacillus laterosporus]NKQ22602.1 hypothetical protein [Brevibacillus laterosporus]PPA81202.1 hypothetical protein C4A75_23515 [Brevibacillus laterosporus]
MEFRISVVEALQGINAKLDSMNHEIKVTQIETKDIKKELSGIKSKMSNIETELNIVKQESGRIKKDIDRIKSESYGIKKDLDLIKSESNGIKKDLDLIKSESNVIRSDLGTIKKKIHDMKAVQTDHTHLLQRIEENQTQDILAILKTINKKIDSKKFGRYAT